MSRSYESPTRKAQAEATRKAILRALVDLLVEEHPATISVPQVAKRAGVSVRIVYHYFPTKDALFEGLVAALPELVSGRAPGPVGSPEELATRLPSAFEYLEANAELFRAVRLSEFGERMQERRNPGREQRTAAALAPLADALDDREMKLLRAVIGSLSSFEGFDVLTRRWGLTTEEAADAAAWATSVLCEHARRSGVAR